MKLQITSISTGSNPMPPSAPRPTERRSRVVRGVFSLLALSVSVLSPGAIARAQTKPATGPPKAAFSPEQLKFYTEQVRPILKVSCFSCHGAGTGVSGGLSLATHASILKGGSSGPAIDLHAEATKSLIVQAINYQGREMPPSGKLPAAQIAVLTKWVEMGAPMVSEKAGAEAVAPSRIVPPQVNAQTMRFWSFRPVKRSAVPQITGPASRWVTNPIDAFILAKLQTKHLSPAERAGKTTLLRRATYDLTGLPPTAEELKAFLADSSPGAYEHIIDRLLASPAYGEKWARHWLDLVRYAESNSFERDNPKPFVWRYRDYVIRSLNSDKPYDRFIKEQLAGDELPDASDESLIATGYYRIGTWDDEPADPEQARFDALDDIVATTGQVFLGLTVNCARCHDHKLDPIPQKDYYSLLSFFQGTTQYGGAGGSVEENSLRPLGPEAEKRRFAAEDTAYRQRLSVVTHRLTEIYALVKKDLAPVEVEEYHNPDAREAILKKRVPALLSEAIFAEAVDLLKQKKTLDQSPPRGLEQALCVTERGKTPDKTFIMVRGNPHVPGDEVKPAFLSILAPPAAEIRPLTNSVPSSGRRLALANWIASPENKLTARVMVNRIWQYHFGRGIVRSTSNFGSLGTPPTHPELLDWLATEFMRNGWRLKPLHRMIMLSSAYRMSSKGNPEGLKRDPENDLFWRFDMRRLDAEEIRDSILTVNGTLNRLMGGPPIYPDIPAEVLAGESRPGANWEISTPEQKARRSVYIHLKRSLAVPILASFDAADTDFTCPVRFATTQPTQALGLMNSVFSNEQAKIFAMFVIKSVGNRPEAQVEFALSRVLQRKPTAVEMQRGVRFIANTVSKQQIEESEALRYFCVVALNLDEFVYID